MDFCYGLFGLLFEMFEMTGRLIKINPDFYSLWNYRKDMVENKIKENPQDLKAICRGEMTLSEMGLRKNPKSYYAWHHRIWIIAKGATDLKHEVNPHAIYVCSVKFLLILPRYTDLPLHRVFE